MLRVFNSPCTKSGGDLLVKGHLWWKRNMGKGRGIWEGHMGKDIWARAYGKGYMDNTLQYQPCNIKIAMSKLPCNIKIRCQSIINRVF